jgi:hypothetical protein
MMTRRDLVNAAGLGATGLLFQAKGSLMAHGTEPSRCEKLAHDAFEHCERRFAEARLRMPDRNPALPDERKAIILAAKACLGVRDAWVPKIRARVVREAAFRAAVLPGEHSWDARRIVALGDFLKRQILAQFETLLLTARGQP